MPTKATDDGKQFKINGKTFTWTTDEGATITIPMRLKMRVIRKLSGQELDAETMFQIIDAIAPGQTEALDDQDVNDFTTMFTCWQREYTALNGATPGE